MQVSRVLVVLIALAGGLSAGCHARVYGRSQVRYVEPVVFVDAPEMVYVGPGVYVVRDYDDAVYYADGYYWSYRGGYWYHTSHWSSPWSRVSVGYVPTTVAYRDHRVYTHYHGDVHAQTFRQTAGYSQHQTVAAHHQSSPPPAPKHVSAGASVHVDAGVDHRGAASAKSHHDSDHSDRQPTRVDRPDRDDRPARADRSDRDDRPVRVERPDRDERAQQPQPQKVKIDQPDPPQQARSDGPKKKAPAPAPTSKRSKKKSK